MFAGQISWRQRHRKCFGQTMFVGMPGMSPVPELATSLFQLCKRSSGTSLTKAGKIFVKRSFSYIDLEHGIYKRSYLWSCATNLLHGSSTVSLPTPSPLKIRDHLETLTSFFLMQEHHSQSSVHPTLWNVGASGCLSRTPAVVAEKNSQTSSLQIFVSMKKKEMVGRSRISLTGYWKRTGKYLLLTFPSYLPELATQIMLVITATEHLADVEPNRNSVQQGLLDSQHHNLCISERFDGVSPQIRAKLREKPQVFGFSLAELIQLTW